MSNGFTDADREKFKHRIQKTPTGCWHWIGFRGNPRQATNRTSIELADGRQMLVRRYIFTLYKAEIPASHEIADCRLDAECINPGHVRLVPKGVGHRQPRGERSKVAKLTDADVLEIDRQLKAGDRAGVIARRFGVSKATIGHINRGYTWGHLTGRKGKLK